MDRSKLKEAYDNADAARLNLETALMRPDRAPDLVVLASQQMKKSLLLLEESLATKAEEKRLPFRVSWIKGGNNVHVAVYNRFQIQVEGVRGDWEWWVMDKDDLSKIYTENTETTLVGAKKAALLSAIQQEAAMEAARQKLRAEPITFAKLEGALERARVQVWDDMKHEDDVDKPMTPRDFSNLLDSFVSTAIGELDPEK